MAHGMMECLKEIQRFLCIDTPQHLKAIAVTNVLSKLYVNFVLISARE